MWGEGGRKESGREGQRKEGEGPGTRLQDPLMVGPNRFVRPIEFHAGGAGKISTGKWG